MQAITILLETNNLQELEMLCSRVLVLKNTKLAFKGELDILKKKYMSYGIVKFNIVSGEIILEDMPFVEYEIDGSYVKIVYEKKWIDAIAVLKHIQKKAVVEHVSISDVDIETIISNIVR